jgi:hypothetical protein
MIYIYFIVSVLISYFFYKRTEPQIDRKKKSVLIILRSLFIFFIIMFLLNPVLFFTRSYQDKPILLVARDRSLSMSQSIAHQTKTAHLSAFERDIATAFRDSNYQIQYIDLFESDPRYSYLIDEIRPHLRSGKNFAGIALSSDGWFTDNPASFRELLHIPIYTFDPAIITAEPEIRIDKVDYLKNVRKNETQTITVDISTKNLAGDIDVSITRSGRQIQKKTIHASPDAHTHQVDFFIRFPDLGLQVYEIVASSLDSESEVSAKDFAAIQVLDHKTKLLLITDSFSWDIRTLNRNLNFSDRFDVDLVYFQNRNFFSHGERKQIQWQEYAGFIVVNHEAIRFADADVNALKTKIVNGAGLIYIGNIIPAFAEMLPASTSNIRIRTEEQISLKSDALAFQVFRDIENHWPTFPPVQFYYLNPKEHSTILAESKDQNRIPVIFSGQFGGGNVLHLAFHGIWRWQLFAPGGVMDRFITDLGQWIFTSRTDNFFAFTDKNLYYSGEKIRVRLSAFDEKLNPLTNINASLRLSKKVDRDTDVWTPDPYTDFFTRTGEMFSLDLPPLPPAMYKYTIYDDINDRQAEGQFEIVEQDIQSMSRGINHRLLSDLSTSSNGRYFTRDELANFSPEKATAMSKTRFIEIPLDRNILITIVVLLLFCTEIYLRKKWGLL